MSSFHRNPDRFARSYFVVGNFLLFALSCGVIEANDRRFSEPTLADVPQLIDSFDDPNIRLGASKAIESIGEPAVSHLVKSLNADNIDLRIWSAYTLGKIGPDASSAAPSLAGLLGSSDSVLRRVAARALGQIRADDVSVIDALAKSSADKDIRVRENSVVSLGKIGPSASAAVAQLIDALDDQPVRAEAIESLVQIGAAASPMLAAALHDDSVRLEAAEVLRRIDGETAKRLGVDKPTSADLAALEAAIHDPDKDLEARTIAVSWLGDIGMEAAPILIAAFADDRREVAEASAAAFADIGPAAIPLLRETLTHPSGQVRAATVDALAAIGSEAQTAVVELIAALADEDPSVRMRTVTALGIIGGVTQPAIDALIGVMQNAREQEATRQLAVKTLVRVAPKQKQAIAALRESTKDRNYGVSSLAKEMLKRLGVDE